LLQAKAPDDGNKNLYCHSRFARVGLQNTSLLPIAPPVFYIGTMSWGWVGLGFISSKSLETNKIFLHGMLMGALVTRSQDGGVLDYTMCNLKALSIF
jgi:hypothetical protein